MSAVPHSVATPESPEPAATYESRPRATRGAGLVRALFVVGCAVAMSAIAWLKYQCYLYDDIDLALFAQALDRCLHGSTFVSVRGMSWLGDHASYVLFLLAPLWALARHPMTLLVVQSAVLALGAVPIERLAGRALARRGTPSPARLAVVAAYLASPALWHLGLFEFHPETIATTALLFALDALTRDRVRACLLWMGLALLAREDVALVAAALGVWALAFRRPRAVTLGVLLIASGLAVLATTLFIVRPQFASAGAQYGAMYHELARAPWQALPRLVWTPGSTPDTVLKLEMLAALLTPLAFLPIAAPATLLVALPAFAEHLLSERSQQHTIVYHYAALLIPVLAWGAMLGLARIARRRPRLGMALAVAMFAMTAVAQLAYGPFALPEWSHARAAERAWPSERDRLEAPVRDRMVEHLPATGTIVASFEFLSRLAERDSLHSLHHLLGGTYTYSSAAYPVPPHVDALLADFAHRRLRPYAASPEAGRRIARVIERNGLKPVEASGDIVRFAREGAPIALVTPGVDDWRGVRWARVDGALDYLGASLADRPDLATGTILLHTLWMRVAAVDAVYLMRLELRDASGRVVATHSRPLGYLVWPVADWPQDDTVLESYAWNPGVRLAPGRYSARMSLARLGSDVPPRVVAATTDALELGSFDVR